MSSINYNGPVDPTTGTYATLAQQMAGDGLSAAQQTAVDQQQQQLASQSNAAVNANAAASPYTAYSGYNPQSELAPSNYNPGVSLATANGTAAPAAAAGYGGGVGGTFSGAGGGAPSGPGVVNTTYGISGNGSGQYLNPGTSGMATAAGGITANSGQDVTDPNSDLSAGAMNQNYANNTANANNAYGNAINQGGQAATQGYNTMGTAAQMMSGVANGTGPSAADIAMQNGINQNNAAIQSAALAQQNGLAPGLTQRNMLDAQAQGNAGIAGQAAQAKAQEQLNAMNGIGQIGGQMANTGVSQQLGGAGGQAGIANNLYQGQGQQYQIQQGQSIHPAQLMSSLGSGVSALGMAAMA